MLTLNTKALTAVAFMGLIAFSGAAQAAEQLLAEPVTLTVNNGFTLAQTTPMNFGSFALLADTAGSATSTINMDPATGTVTPTSGTPSQAVLVSAVGQSRGVYAVSAALANADLTVTINNLVDLTCSACTTTPPAIDLTSVTADDATPTTDGTGAATINIGALLTTVAGGNQYEDGAYAGSFDLTVAY